MAEQHAKPAAWGCSLGPWALYYSGFPSQEMDRQAALRNPSATDQLLIRCHISTNGCHSDSPQHPSPHEPKQLLDTSRKQTTAFHIPFFWLLQSHPHRESQMQRRGHYQVREGLTALCQPPARQQGSFVQHMLGGFFTVIQE